MAKDPAFLFYSQDFIVGVQLLNFTERGQYITLLAMMHQSGRMREETIRLLVGEPSDNLRLKFDVDEGGFWYSERLELEINKRANFIKSRQENGSKGGRKPKEKTIRLKVGKAKTKLPVNENEDVNEDIFLKYASELLKEKYPQYEFALKQKYAAWVADGWKDGNGNEIKNWKTKLGNTIPYLKPMSNYGKVPQTLQNDQKLAESWES